MPLQGGGAASLSLRNRVILDHMAEHQDMRSLDPCYICRPEPPYQQNNFPVDIHPFIQNTFPGEMDHCVRHGCGYGGKGLMLICMEETEHNQVDRYMDS